MYLYLILSGIYWCFPLCICFTHFNALCVLVSALSESVKLCGAEALDLLGLMKQRDSLTAADSSRLKAALEAILATAEVHTHYYTIHIQHLHSLIIKCVKVSPELLYYENSD